MKTSIKSLLALVLGVVLPLSVCAQDSKLTKPVPALGDGVLVNVTAAVTAINLETRELTLKGPLGNVVTLTVDQRVKRLGEIKVGDNIAVAYYVSLAAELRPPTEDEKQNPIQTSKELVSAPPGTMPAGGGLHVVKAVVTVEGLDRTTSSATLKGPRGNIASVRVKDPAILNSLKLGDTVVVTYTEALAVELQPAPAPAAPAAPAKAG